MKKTLLLFVTLSAVVLALPTKEIDVVNLKDGSVLKGKIVEQNFNEYIKIELEGGSVMVVTNDEIESVSSEKVKKDDGSTMKGVLICVAIFLILPML